VDPFHWVMGTRLEVPTKLVPADVLFGVVALLALLPALRRWRPRAALVRLGVTVAGALVGLLACWVVGDLMNAFDVVLTPVTRMWVALATGSLALAVAAIAQGGRGRRVLGGVLVPLALLVPALGVNVDYAAYPTLNALVQPQPFPVLDLADPAATPVVAAAPTAGRIGTVHIPATRSGFPARPTVVYLPPAALRPDPPALPVIVSLSGQPGSPGDMFTVGRIATVLDAYAARHHGEAPIVVSADQLAVAGHNPMCVDSSIGNSATYITEDVPAWVTSHLHVDPDRGSWGLVGFSQGATCAMQFLSGHPDRFAAALAISSELQPVDRGPQNSADEAFGGSLRQWEAAAPRAVLAAHGHYRATAVWLTAGAADHRFVDDARALGKSARAAGIHTVVVSAPGSGHDWNTVQWSLTNELPHEADALFAAAR